MAIHPLVVQHQPGSDPPVFRVVAVRGADLKAAEPVLITPLDSYPVPGRSQSNLARELRWYLEWFLDYPFPPETEHAAEVQATLKRWGCDAFCTLFGTAQAGGFFDHATHDGLPQLLLQVSSDDARILAWPWEALEDPAGQILAQTCRLERRLNHQYDPPPLAGDLPQDRINILLVTARPYEADVGYRSISRRLVELVKTRRLPASVTLLRPPTLDALRRQLAEKPHYYQVVHFDVHGSYCVPGAAGSAPAASTAHAFHGPQGHLVFEQADGQPDPQPASTLSNLLQEYRIPAVVLNACQSGTIDSQAGDAFASVATGLLKAGVRSVTAMAYSLYVSGAQQFLPAFYERLFATGEFAEAIRAGRQQMLASKGRVCARGTYELDDWLVPVLYQQGDLRLPFAAASSRAPGELSPADGEAREPALPEVDLPYGFIGRDGAILRLERALHRAPPVLLVNGLGGVGKTTLAWGFAQWLADTGGFASGGLFWFDFREILAAESVVNRMGEALFGQNFSTAPLDKRLAVLAGAMKDRRFLIVWDNFEVACGIEGTAVGPRLSAEDRHMLQRFVRSLAGGQTKVLITSRSSETWLGLPDRFKLTMGGLAGEERWEFCEAVLRAQGRRVDRSDPDLGKLLQLLGGHPLAMRVLLPRLEGQSAAGLRRELEEKLAAPGAGGGDDPEEQRLFATLRFALEVLPAELRPLLVPLSLHERFVDGDYLEAMAKQVDASWTRVRIDAFLTALSGLGLLTDRGQAVYDLHPLAARCLQAGAAQDPAREAWARAFVDVMASVADAAAPLPPHQQRGIFFLHELNFHAALVQAEGLGMGRNVAALVQALGAYAQNTRNFAAAAAWFTRLAGHEHASGGEEGEAAAYHQLGMIAEEQRDFAAAERWYRRSLGIKERLGNEPGAASTYHQLGVVAGEQGDPAAAERWYHKSLEINERLGDEHGAAGTYHQLGIIAQEQRDFAAAEKWYRKSLEITERLGDEHDAADTYHQLGRIAQERQDFAAAEKWYHKSLEINERQGDDHSAAITYGQLGVLARLQGDSAGAAGRFVKAARLFQRQSAPDMVQRCAGNLLIAMRQAGADERPRLRQMWAEAGLPPLPPDGP